MGIPSQLFSRIFFGVELNSTAKLRGVGYSYNQVIHGHR